MINARLLLRATALGAGTLLLVAAHGGGAQAAVPAPITPAARTLLTRVGILPGDLARGYTVRLEQDGESLIDPTLDNCNFRFTTETARVARRQVEVVDPAGDSMPVGSEAVLYKSDAFASKAMAEWRTSVARCRPLTWTKGDIPADDYRIDSESNRTSTSLPSKDNFDSNLLIRPRGSKISYRVLVIGQRKGSVVTITFVFTTAKPIPGDVKGLQFLAGRTGQRLLAAVR